RSGGAAAQPDKLWPAGLWSRRWVSLLRRCTQPTNWLSAAKNLNSNKEQILPSVQDDNHPVIPLP
ncbi:MAG TPA: hypothetical protein PKL60_08085, partial [Anaerolineaceae bacterium]|nr:hypothetical protein [Anaerolineaceae bacterium]